MLCKICAGNGELVTDGDRYLHAHDGDIGDEAVGDCDECFGTGLDQDLFDQWIATLSEDVIEGEYGYVSGEFSVTPELWEPMYRSGLTPLEAFKHALDEAERARRQRSAISG